jgi:ketosteroid isomerase-like protein
MRTIHSGWRFRAGLLAGASVALVAGASVLTLTAANIEVGTLLVRTTAERPAPETDAIRSIIEKYARSVDAADTELAATIWSKSADVSFIHPRGHEHGWQEVKRNIYETAMGATFSERKLTPRDFVVNVYGDVAWAEFYWDFVAKLRSNGAEMKTSGRETQIYRKADGRWELVHVHYSGMPVTAARQGS